MKLKELDEECLCLSKDDVKDLYGYFKNVFFVEKEIFSGAKERAETLKKFYKALSLIESDNLENDIPRYLTKRET